MGAANANVAAINDGTARVAALGALPATPEITMVLALEAQRLIDLQAATDEAATIAFV